MKNTSKRAFSPQSMVLTALFTAIILLTAFTPLGLIDLPIIKATILHVPVIIGSILLGPKKGAFFGLLFALTSLLKNTMEPSLLSFAFSPLVPVPGTAGGSLWALAICFIPRILVGVVPWLVFEGLKRAGGDQPARRTLWLAVSGASGAIVNTGLVMGMIRLLLSGAFAAAKGIPAEAVGGAVMGIVLANGIPETLAAVVITTAVCTALTKAMCLPGKKSERPCRFLNKKSRIGYRKDS